MELSWLLERWKPEHSVPVQRQVVGWRPVQPAFLRVQERLPVPRLRGPVAPLHAF